MLDAFLDDSLLPVVAPAEEAEVPPETVVTNKMGLCIWARQVFYYERTVKQIHNYTTQIIYVAG